MGLHYIYVDTKHKKDDEVISDVSINLHNPITNVKRVGVSSFTTSNSSHNITENNNNITEKPLPGGRVEGTSP